MNLVLLLLACLIFLIGLAGVIIPMLPGLPLCWLAFLLLKLTRTAGDSLTWRGVVLWGVVTVIVTLLDNILPVWGTKKAGGSRFVVLCATVGLVAGLFFGLPGILLGPFFGALAGALLERHSVHTSLSQAGGAFFGLMAGIVIKLICAGVMLVQIVRAL